MCRSWRVHLLKRFRPHLRPGDELFTPEAMEKLQQHDWPGNVRELANVVEHASILCDELPIGVEHLPDRFGTRRLADRCADRPKSAADYAARSGNASDLPIAGTQRRQQAENRRRIGHQPEDAVQQTEPEPEPGTLGVI